LVTKIAILQGVYTKVMYTPWRWQHMVAATC
jgi:hypothetical protein